MSMLFQRRITTPEKLQRSSREAAADRSVELSVCLSESVHARALRSRRYVTEFSLSWTRSLPSTAHKRRHWLTGPKAPPRRSTSKKMGSFSALKQDMNISEHLGAQSDSLTQGSRTSHNSLYIYISLNARMN